MPTCAHCPAGRGFRSVLLGSPHAVPEELLSLPWKGCCSCQPSEKGPLSIASVFPSRYNGPHDLGSPRPEMVQGCYCQLSSLRRDFAFFRISTLSVKFTCLTCQAVCGGAARGREFGTHCGELTELVSKVAVGLAEQGLLFLKSAKAELYTYVRSWCLSLGKHSAANLVKKT